MPKEEKEGKDTKVDVESGTSVTESNDREWTWGGVLKTALKGAAVVGGVVLISAAAVFGIPPMMRRLSSAISVFGGDAPLALGEGAKTTTEGQLGISERTTIVYPPNSPAANKETQDRLKHLLKWTPKDAAQFAQGWEVDDEEAEDALDGVELWRETGEAKDGRDEAAQEQTAPVTQTPTAPQASEATQHAARTLASDSTSSSPKLAPAGPVISMPGAGATIDAVQYIPNPTGENEEAVVFYHIASTLYAQKVNKDGLVGQWKVVSGYGGYTGVQMVHAIPSSDGNCWIAWGDIVNTTPNLNLQKFNTSSLTFIGSREVLWVGFNSYIRNLVSLDNDRIAVVWTCCGSTTNLISFYDTKNNSLALLGQFSYKYLNPIYLLPMQTSYGVALIPTDGSNTLAFINQELNNIARNVSFPPMSILSFPCATMPVASNTYLLYGRANPANGYQAGYLLSFGDNEVTVINPSPLSIINSTQASNNPFFLTMHALHTSQGGKGVLAYNFYYPSIAPIKGQVVEFAVTGFDQPTPSITIITPDTPLADGSTWCQNDPTYIPLSTSLTDDNYLYIALNLLRCNDSASFATVQYWSTSESGMAPAPSITPSSQATSTMPESHASDPKTGIGAGAIAGIAIGVFVSAAVVIAATATGIVIWRKRQPQNTPVTLESAAAIPPSSPPSSPVKSPRVALLSTTGDGQQHILPADLQRIKELGRGSYGVVYRGTYRGSEIAIKELPRNLLKCPEILNSFDDEASLMTQLKHPNIVAFYGICREIAGTEISSYLIVMELMPGGSLEEFLLRPSVASDQLGSIAYNIVSGMVYLHENKVIHRDLKPANVLLVFITDGKVVAKISDFGTSRVVEQQKELGMTKGIGTPIYMAPEVTASPPVYSEKADVFSFGITAWQMFTKKTPYAAECERSWDVVRFVTSGNRLPVPDDCNPQLSKAITSCWDQKPEKRPTMRELLPTFEHSKGTLFASTRQKQNPAATVPAPAPAATSSSPPRPISATTATLANSRESLLGSGRANAARQSLATTTAPRSKP